MPSPEPRITACRPDRHGYPEQPLPLDTPATLLAELPPLIAVCDCGAERWLWVTTEAGSYGWQRWWPPSR